MFYLCCGINTLIIIYYLVLAVQNKKNKLYTRYYLYPFISGVFFTSAFLAYFYFYLYTSLSGYSQEGNTMKLFLGNYYQGLIPLFEGICSTITILYIKRKSSNVEGEVRL